MCRQRRSIQGSPLGSVTPFLYEAVKTRPINEIFLAQLPAIQLAALAESLYESEVGFGNQLVREKNPCGGEGVDQIPIFQLR